MNEQQHLLYRQYLTLARNAAGIGPVLGGVLFLLAYFVGALLPLHHWGRLSLVVVPLLYVLGREGLRVYYYQQRDLQLRQPNNNWQWFLHTLITVLTILASLGLTASVVGASLWLLEGQGYLFSEDSPWPITVYILLLLAAPVIVWFCLWTLEDYILGFLLMIHAGRVLQGESYRLGEWPLALVVAIAMMILGLLEYRKYRVLKQRLQTLNSET
jgi:hypothetical protein